MLKLSSLTPIEPTILELLEKIKSAGYDDVEEKFQGEDNLLRYLENNPELTKYFFEDFKKTLENLFK